MKHLARLWLSIRDDKVQGCKMPHGTDQHFYPLHPSPSSWDAGPEPSQIRFPSRWAPHSSVSGFQITNGSLDLALFVVLPKSPSPGDPQDVDSSCHYDAGTPAAMQQDLGGPALAGLNGQERQISEKRREKRDHSCHLL